MANLLEIIVKAKDEASRTLNSIAGNVEKFSGQLKAAGLAMTALGAAGLKVASDARKMNADLGYTGQIIGATTEEMREMVLAITDVTFGVKTVIATFEMLARSGVRDQETMKKNALALDALADATKSEADVVADILIPAYKMFGEVLPQSAREMDKWTYLVTSTNVSLTELGGLMGYVATYGRELNLTAEQLVVIMKAMAEQGRSASDAARLFRTGIKQAEGDMEKFYKILGLTNDEIELYTQELRDSEGITADLQEQQAEQYTVMDKLKQKWQELILSAGDLLEALEPVFSVMTALGGVTLTTAYALPPLVKALNRLKIAMLGVKLEAIAMWGAITLGVSLAITGIVELVNKIKEAEAATEEYDEALDSIVETMKYDVDVASKSMIRSLQDEQEALITGLEERRRLWKEAHWERMSQLTEQFFAEMMAISPEIAAQIKPIWEEWQKTQDIIKETTAAINAIDLEDARAELESLRVDPEATERSILQAQLAVAQLEIPPLDEQFEDIMQGISETDIETYFNQAVADVQAEYGPLISQWETVWKDAFYDWRVDWAANVQDGMMDYQTELERWIPKFKETWEEMFPEMPVPKIPEMPARPPVAAKAYGIVQPFLNLIGITQEDWDKFWTGMQAGGIVTQPTRAIIAEREPEAVIPLSKMPSGDVHVHVGYLMGDEVSLRKFVRYVQQMMGEESRRTQFGQLQSGYFFGRSAP